MEKIFRVCTDLTRRWHEIIEMRISVNLAGFNFPQKSFDFLLDLPFSVYAYGDNGGAEQQYGKNRSSYDAI